MDLREIPYEAPLTQFLLNKASSQRIPLSGTFELSPVCNFSCRMCYVRKTLQEVKEHSRPMVTYEKWLEIAKAAKKEGLLYLLLTGGEPFLWPDFWKLYEELIQMGFLVTINTNGSLIDEKATERLKKSAPTRVNITLYGASDETYEALCGIKGGFSRVDSGIRRLQEAGIDVKLNCSLTPHNAADLEKMNLYAAERGLIFEVNTYMFPPVRRDPGMIGQNERFTPKETAYYHLKRYRVQYGEEMYVQFLKKVVSGLTPPPGIDESCVDPIDGKICCRAGNASFWVSWDGWLMPCGMMPEPKADIMEQSFSDAWKELTKASDCLQLSGICSKCENCQMCHSCAAMAMAETGSTTGIPKYLCEMVLEMKHLAEEELLSLKL